MDKGRSDVAIKMHAGTVIAICAWCPERMRLLDGPEMFQADDLQPVCHPCARKRSPELVDMLLDWRAKRQAGGSPAQHGT